MDIMNYLVDFALSIPTLFANISDLLNRSILGTPVWQIALGVGIGYLFVRVFI